MRIGGNTGSPHAKKSGCLLGFKLQRLLPSFYLRRLRGGLESTSVLRETELLRDVLRLSCRAVERDLMQTASKGHWTDG